MTNEISITQSIEQTGDASFTVTMDVDGELTFYDFTDTNGIWPLYRSLFDVIRDRELDGVAINLTTNAPKFAAEIQGRPGRHTTLLNTLLNIKERNAIIINIIE